MDQVQLPKGYRFVELPDEEFQKLWGRWGKKIFRDQDLSLDVFSLLSEKEKRHLRDHRSVMSRLYKFNLCIFKGSEFCGWFVGDQMNHETFYMRNSAILPAHRRKGLYTALMNEVLSRVKRKGFQIVMSRHNATNNAIIVPKLKVGFIITSLEISDRFGTLVNLTYFFNKKRRLAMDVRSGEKKPDKRIRQALGLK